MRSLAFLILAVLAAGMLSGCGDPAPSTTLAPEQKLPDASKMSTEDVNKQLQNGPTSVRK